MKKNGLAKGVSSWHKLMVGFAALLVATAGSVSFAHKVHIFAYVEGDTVCTESYFSDGTKAQGGIVEVYDSEGNKLLEGRTGENGEFNFKPPKKDNLRLVLTTPLGHRNVYTLSADDEPDIIGAEKVQQGHPKEPEANELGEVHLDQIKTIIDTSLDEKLEPIIRELTRMQHKQLSFTEVIGGIGYIFGIMGIILYFVSKKRE